MTMKGNMSTYLGSLSTGKGSYNNDDFKTQPNRRTLPAPGDMEDHYPHTIDTGDQLNDPLSRDSASSMTPKNKCCIM
ncbi:hypothetical protein Btru_005772 [Bulinus truncatus]|nr:hypothetical protein Btru_005772 [Bulinus truncatus]